MDEKPEKLAGRKIELMGKAIDEFGGRIAALKSAVGDAYMLQSAATIEEVTESNEEVEIGEGDMTQEFSIQETVDAVLADPTVGREEKAAAIQEALGTYVEVVKGQLDQVAPPDINKAVNEAVAAQLAPVTEQLALIAAKLSGPAQADPTQAPQQKSFVPQSTAVGGPAMPDITKPISITQLARKSVGLDVQ